MNSISPSNEHPGLICFRIEWLELLAAQGTLKSLLQHQSSKASILQCSALFMVQLSHPYVTTGKTIALTTRSILKFEMLLGTLDATPKFPNIPVSLQGTRGHVARPAPPKLPVAILAGSSAGQMWQNGS